jgi:hypothetical protein
MSNSNVMERVRHVFQFVGKKFKGRGSWDLGKEASQDNCRIIVASTQAIRERAYRLAYRVYRAEGYVSEDRTCMLVAPFDAQPETFTILAEDSHGRAMGTVSLVFDSPKGLPCGEIYQDELNPLRSEGRRLAEVVRLAVDKSYPHSRMLLIRMFNFLAIFSRRVRKDTDFVIEVNPHHVEYYRRMLLFEQLGPERVCPRVNGAPAVLLRIDLSVMEKEIRLVTAKDASAVRRRTGYAHAYTLDQEVPIAQFLARHHKPMTAREAEYFGLTKKRQGSGRDTMKLLIGAMTEECLGPLQHNLVVERIRVA